MKNIYSLKNQLLAALLFLLFAAGCKKTDLMAPNTEATASNARAFGAVEDDPARLARIPVIASAGYIDQLLMAEQTTQKAGKGNTGGGGSTTGSTSDVTAPSVSITSPASGTSVSGTLTIAVSASDNVGVNSVSLSVDGSVVATLTVPPYNFSWNAGSVADGVHTLTARAADAAGNSSTSSISVTKNTTVVSTPTLPSTLALQTPPVGLQGSEFSCVAFAAGYAARSIEQYYKYGNTSYSTSINIFSPEYLYDQTKISTDCGSGTSIMQALDFMVNNGICRWSVMPYSDANGCSLVPSGSQSTDAFNYRIASYSAISKSDITAIKTALYNHHPVIFTAALDNSFINAGPGFIWKYYSGSQSISHALTICGYDDSKHAWKVMNSWGTSWGDAGYSWIDYDFLPLTGSAWTFQINL